MEIFKSIKNNLNYMVGNEGTIKRRSDGKILKPRIGKQGLLQIRLNHCFPKDYYIRRLVAEYFVPNPNKLQCVAHLNGNRLDNRASNLIWVSMSDVKMQYSKSILKIKIKGSFGYFKSVPRCAEYFCTTTKEIVEIIDSNQIENKYNIEWS